MTLTLNWYYTDSGNYRYELDGLDLNSDKFDNLEGIYIIYYLDRQVGLTRAVYVGQGAIRDRLYVHRRDDRIQQHANNALNDTLYVAWSEVSSTRRDGIEKYLHEKLNPLVREISPAVPPQSVNLPWETTSPTNPFKKSNPFSL
ncbi:MAG: hypothetical protein OXI43_21580 [Candidatus Poribacteria bacterium]|nr:hypothetical protein [Candidatus Poribacteria bacterium]